jgi:hypothetical protein
MIKCTGCDAELYSDSWEMIFIRKFDGKIVKAYFNSYACYLEWKRSNLAESVVKEIVAYAYPIDPITGNMSAKELKYAWFNRMIYNDGRIGEYIDVISNCQNIKEVKTNLPMVI